MKRIFPIALIVCGSALEVWYYTTRFAAEGTALYLAIIQGLALTLLLIGLFRLRKNRLSWLLIIPLALYSIFNTAAGQRQALTMEASRQAIVINTEQIEDLERQASRKRDRYEAVEDLLDASIDDFEDAYYWRNTTARYEEELRTLDGDIAVIEDQVMAMRRPTVDDTQIGAIYQFYSGLTGVAPDWLQFWLQIAFSLFIAIMAPVGILLIPVKPTKRRRSRAVAANGYVDQWVQTNWVGIRTGQSNSIFRRDSFARWAKERGVTFPQSVYEKIREAAESSGVISGLSIVEVDEAKAAATIKRRLSQ